MDQYIGRLLDNRYEILEIIGTGGMAVVYKARCHRLNRLVAIKILKDEFSRDEEFRRRFHHEGEAVAMLSHPNIVQVYDVSSSDNANFIVMELIDGITLKQYMEKRGTLNWKETLHFAMQIAKALEHAHGRGIVHRDIKPHNVMVLKNGSVKVTDFGIARVMSKSNTLTKEALGSVHYISPEQAKGGWVDNRSDLYSLGVVMYEMMTGRPPYDGESPVAVAIQHINGGAMLPSVLNPNIPSGLEQIIMKSMALDTKDRYSSATEMLEDMEEFRKNPAIVFAVPNTGIDDATRVLDTASVAEAAARQPKTTAERVAGSAGAAAAAARARNTGSQPRVRNTGNLPRTHTAEQPRIRTAEQPRAASGPVRMSGGTAAGSAASGRGGQPVRKTREEIREEIREEERNRMATIMIVGCSAVAVIAIIIFIILLANGVLLGQGDKRVTVPDFVGDYYNEIQEPHGLTVEIGGFDHSETVEKNRIMEQTPEAGASVVEGTVVKITVSLGPEPLVKTLAPLTGMSQEDAQTYLRDLGMVPLPKEEFSEDYEKGKVVRTDPESGAELKDGQTVILYISKGSVIEMEYMPNVVGYNVATAEKMLNDFGFDVVRFEHEYDDADKDEVIGQSIDKGTIVDVTTEIVLTVSKGPKESDKEEEFPDVPIETMTPVTEAPTEAPTDPPTEAPTQPKETEPPKPTEPPVEDVTVSRSISLPSDMTEDYVLSIYQNGKPVIVDKTITAGKSSIDVVLTGTGTQDVEVYINGSLYNTEKVEFTSND